MTPVQSDEQDEKVETELKITNLYIIPDLMEYK